MSFTYTLNQHGPGLLQEAELAAEIYPRQDLEVDFSEQDGLAYLDAPFSVFRSTHANGTRFDVLVDHPALESAALVNLLNEVAPNKRDPQDKYDIIADWNILDTLTPGQVSSPELTQLIRLHSYLGAPWQQFAVSQPAFIQTLRDATPGRLHDGLVTSYEFRRYTDKRFLLSRLVLKGADSLDELMEKLEESGVKHADRFVLQAVANSKSIIRRKNRNKKGNVPVSSQTEPELLRRFSAAPLERRTGLTEKIVYSLLSQEQRDALLMQLDGECDKATVDNELWAYPRDELPEGVTLAELVADRRTISVGVHDMQVIDILLKNGSTKTVGLEHTQQKVRVGTTLVPRISWVKRPNGERSLVIERHRADLPEGETRHIDGVLGALVLAYIQPDQRSAWPAFFKIRGRVQNMEAAQVPVLALMKEHNLLQGPFVQAAESASSSTRRKCFSDRLFL